MLAIFDWDGTLMDSTAKIINCMLAAAAGLGLKELEREAVQNIIGLGLPEAIRHIYPEVEPALAESLRLQYSQHFVHVDQTPTPLFAGVAEGLKELRAADIPMAIATGKSRRGLDRILSGLDLQHFFVATRCADETASKPNPLMLEQLLAEVTVANHGAVMVGDTEYDMAMAQALAMPRIAVDYGAHSIARLRVYEPVLCATHFMEVKDWLLKQAG